MELSTDQRLPFEKMEASPEVLFIEDSEEDKNLVLTEFQNNGITLQYTQVKTESELKKELEKDHWQLVLCNYSLADFDALSALHIVREKDANIPFIIISDALGEQVAVRAMRAGANDYILKNNMGRLLPSIEKELKETENHILHDQLENEKELLLNVVQQSKSEIYIVNDETLKFEYVNKAALDNLGYSEDEIKNLTPYDINPESDENRFLKTLELLFENKIGSIFFSTYHKREDGSSYPIELQIQLISQNRNRYAVSTGIDLTDRKKNARTLKKHKKIAEELTLANKYKSQFLANMSHELRTPLNSINLLSRLLMRNGPGNLNKEQLEYLDVILKSGNNLLDLINEVLDFSQVEVGEITIQLEDTPVKKICSSLEMMFSPIAQEKGLRLLSNRKNFTKSILTDPIRLEQILKNLLSNALKFTDNGTIELSVDIPEQDEINDKDEYEDWIAFRVRDTGIGIPEDKHELIFEAFQQTDHSTQRIYGGTGLGLSICRELADLLGGTLALQSELGKGSTFSLYLPADATKVLDPSSYRRNESKKTDSDIYSFIGPPALLSQQNSGNDYKDSKRILLVDDSEIHVSALKELLETDKRECLVAGSAHDTLKVLESIEIDCLVLDLGLPDANGFEVIKKIKNNKRLNHLPIIVYTGKSLSDNEEKQLNKLVSSIIIKTSNSFKRLQESIEKLLEFSDAQSRFPEVIENEKLRDKKVLIVDDDKWNVYSLSLVLEEIGLNLLVASNGKEALEILEKSPDVDFLLMDVMMPMMDGYETIKKIRRIKTWRKLPAIAVTSKTMEGERERCLEAGFTEYLSKPIKIHTLIELLSEKLI